MFLNVMFVKFVFCVCFSRASIFILIIFSCCIRHSENAVKKRQTQIQCNP